MAWPSWPWLVAGETPLPRLVAWPWLVGRKVGVPAKLESSVVLRAYP